jgi:hypothetical protein
VIRDLLRWAVELLDRCGVPYMLAGSFASNEYGELRTTQDVDIVIDPSRQQLSTMLDELSKADVYVDADAALGELTRRGMFNVVDLATGWKIDFIIRKDRPFSETELERRVTTTSFGFPVPIATAEDVVLSKLEWAARGRSERQLRDVRQIVRVQRGRLDEEYLYRWARELGVEDLLREAMTEEE